LHGLARGQSIERVSESAFRITRPIPRRARRSRRTAPLRGSTGGFVREGASSRLRPPRMDMDSTLISIECIDEIADFAGRKAEVAA
jgi:phosphoserine phosphatase